jgi:glycosyltransferase involved in cell wall biosynthesis
VRRADVVHVHECVNLSTWSAVALARRARRPVVLTQHVGYVPYGPVLDRVERLAYHGAGRAILERVDARVVVSPHVADWFRSIGVRAPFSWIPNARDERRFRLADAQERRDARSRFGVSPAETVVLFAARFVPKKGVDVVAEVWPRIAARRPDWRLVVAGEGPLESELRRLPGVVFLGQQPQHAMPELFAAADVFWLPSRGEGFPLTVQEAMLCGLPVVVSRDPSYLANLAGIEGAWLVEADGIAGALDAARSVDRAAVAEGARGRWSRRVMVDRYLDLYRQVRGSAGA